ncbi:HIT domain-containing protein [Candidatus Pacearchaeota archaeon]|nr:HIT domain-containing protein [Candidatus Pacearchaeota archaeon]
MIDSLYDMKPLGEWLDYARGCIWRNDAAFVALNLVPSTLGHCLVAPRRVVGSLSELTAGELRGFIEAKEQGLKALKGVISTDSNSILRVYDLWDMDAELEKKVPGSVKRRAVVIRDLEQGPCEGANYFENHGETAGQMIRHFHGQLVPRYGIGKGMGAAIFNLTHPQLQ